MKSLFNFITVVSLRLRLVTLALVLVVIALGVVSASELKQELLPPIEFPQTFIFAQVSGMTSEEVLTVMTERVEEQIKDIPGVVNVQSTTTNAIGAFVIVSNEFGINQERFLEDLQVALDGIWLPQRRIAPADGQDTGTFAVQLLQDLSSQQLIYWAEQDGNFLFQLSPEVWSALSDDTLQAVLAYLANQAQSDSSEKSALERLVEQDVLPQLRGVEAVARLSISGGQALPGEEAAFEAVEVEEISDAARSQLLQLSRDVWEVIASRLDLGELNESAVITLQTMEFILPEDVPALPESWQTANFKDVTDIEELTSLQVSLADILNDFYNDGVIAGALGQTDDLTPDVVAQLLEIEPSLVNYFGAEHLVAMSPDVFAVLPDEFILELDGFTRDELAAASLAVSLSGKEASPEPVDLPSAWQLQTPQILSFSFADLPLATYSIYSVGDGVVTSSDSSTEAVNDMQNAFDEQDEADEPDSAEIPEGPALAPIWGILGAQFGGEFNTVDDLINIELPAETADQFGGGSLSAADLMGFFILLADPSAIPDGVELPPVSINPSLILGGFSAEDISFLIEYDSTFLPNLNPQVFEYFADEVLALPEISPPLGNTWSTLSNRPQFASMPLETADDLLQLGDGSASEILNLINETVPDQFAGYEVRLFDSLSVGTVRYLALNDTDLYSNLSGDVLLKMSPAVLAQLSEDVLEELDSEIADPLLAIANGESPSAIEQLAELYSSDVTPADPTAPALNDEWQFIAGFLGVELNNVFDFYRFPDALGTPSQFINGLFDSPAGANFAPDLLGNLSLEAFQYLSDRDTSFVTDLRPEAVSLLSEEVFGTLPSSVQDSATSGEVFKPTSAVTRNNGAPSLFVTVFKDQDANTVETFYDVEAVIEEISTNNDEVEVQVAFEQASFIETSIEGVVREGTLGAVFATIIILVFLSGGGWSVQARRIVGTVITVLFAVLLALLIASGLEVSGGDWSLAFAQADVVIRILFIMGTVSGLAILFFPSNLPYPAWRSTLVIAVSIPLSLFMALAGMHWLSPAMHGLLEPGADSSGLIAFLLRLFPENITLNIMTLSGLTVAIGRVVDDSIVVLENIYRQMQSGMDKREAILYGTRDVSVAIFSATGIAVIVFLPLGLTGGLISEFFLPFGLAVTYALLASFIVAISVVPVLVYLFVSIEDIPDEHETIMERIYVPILRWSLSSRGTRLFVLSVAFFSFVASGILLGTRPAAFLPAFGEPQLSASISLPPGTGMLETNALVEEFEVVVASLVEDGTIPAESLSNVQVVIGGGGPNDFEALFGGGGIVSENEAEVNVLIQSQEILDAVTPILREEAFSIFGEEYVTVSAASLGSGDFNSVELTVSGVEQDVLIEFDSRIIEAMNNIEGITNVTSNLEQVASGSGDSATYIRINGVTAATYQGDLETQDTINVTTQAIEAINGIPELPEGIEVSQGFTSEIQSEGFIGIFIAMGISIVMMIIILIVTFNSFIYWIALILSIMVAPVGAALALTLTDRAVSISATIGLLMLFGLVVTNAVVLLDRVGSNRSERGMSLYDALIEAGGRRVRPILMTALATIIALLPLAVGLSEGAIIAAELGTVVIGGVFSSTLLTLIVVPVAYSMLTPLHDFFARLFGRGGRSAHTGEQEEEGKEKR